MHVTRYQGSSSGLINWNDPDLIHIVGARSHWRDCSPGHIELWLCGWTPGNYRSSFALYPLPASIALLPHILKYVHTEQARFDCEKPIIVDLRPDHNVLIFRQSTSARLNYTIQPWISKLQWEIIIALAEQGRPETPITQAEYDRRIAEAKIRAQAHLAT